MSFRDFLFTLAIPLAMVLAGVAVARALRPQAAAGAERPAWAPWLSIVATGGAITFGTWQILEIWPEFPATQATQWQIWIAITSAVVGVVIEAMPRNRAGMAINCALVVTLAVLILLYPLKNAVGNPDKIGVGWRKWAGCSAAVAGIAGPVLLAWLGGGRARHAGTPAALMVAMVIGVGALMEGEVSKHARIAALASMPMGVMMVAALVWRPWEIGRGVVAALLPVYGAAWLMAMYFDGVPRLAAALGMIAPGAVVVAALPWLKKRPIACAAAQIIAAGALAGAAMWVVKSQKPPPQDAEQLDELWYLNQR